MIYGILLAIGALRGEKRRVGLVRTAELFEQRTGTRCTYG